MQSIDRFIPPRDENWFQSVALYSHPDTDKKTENKTVRQVHNFDIYKRELYSACNGFELQDDRRWLFPFSGQKSLLKGRQVGAITALSSLLTSPYRKILESEKRAREFASSEFIPTFANRTLDAPGYLQDFYLSLLDASHEGPEQIAIALNQDLYTYAPNASRVVGQRRASDESYYTVVRWLNRPGRLLAGELSGEIHHIDVERKVSEWSRRVPQELLYPICAEPVGMHSMVVGFKSGVVVQLDSREPARANLIGRVAGNNSVCALRLHANNNYLASGANDNLVRLWDVRQPRHEVLRIEDHLGAVKALAWSPTSDDLLFSGGGAADKTIKVTSLKAQKVIASEPRADSQITGLHVSEDGKRVASCHGFNRNSVMVWKYDGGFKLVEELTGPHDRILGSTMLQDRATLITASADETVRFWNVFMKKNAQEKGNPIVRTQAGYRNQATSKMLSLSDGLR